MHSVLFQLTPWLTTLFPDIIIFQETYLGPQQGPRKTDLNGFCRAAPGGPPAPCSSSAWLSTLYSGTALPWNHHLMPAAAPGVLERPRAGRALGDPISLRCTNSAPVGTNRLQGTQHTDKMLSMLHIPCGQNNLSRTSVQLHRLQFVKLSPFTNRNK